MRGICVQELRLCFSQALWNGCDPILKERAFGLTGNEGNHGEDVEEAYFYLDATPTHSYLHYRYKYPHSAFPYQQLVYECAKRTPETICAALSSPIVGHRQQACICCRRFCFVIPSLWVHLNKRQNCFIGFFAMPQLAWL